jgi:hypothetical protein
LAELETDFQPSDISAAQDANNLNCTSPYSSFGKPRFAAIRLWTFPYSKRTARHSVAGVGIYRGFQGNPETKKPT